MKEAEKLLESYPESRQLKLAYIQALAEKGDETKVLQIWNKEKSELQKDRHALEILAWGVLKKGDLSSQVNIHLNALIGAALTRDVRAVPMLVDAMRGTNALLRMIAVKFTASYGDGPLQEELKRLLAEEKVWFVRLEVIRTIGALRIASLRESLKEIIANPKTLTEEKAEAILALVQMYDGVRVEDLKHLLSSNRAGLRQLGCQLISYFDLHPQVKELMPLLCDSSPDVRMDVLHTLGLIGAKISGDQLQQLMEDSSPMVAITACWVAVLQGIDDGLVGLEGWLRDFHPQWRLLAAATLNGCGTKGLTLALQEMEKNPDPYVRLNLAIGLIGQRVEIQRASEVLYSMFVEEEKALWMWDDNFHFRILSPSYVNHIEQIPNYPKVVDQLVRLDILNILCMMHHPQAQEAIKRFVKNESWGVTGAAIAVLLEEGDEEALREIHGFLKDEDPKIRMQAALILALLGNDPVAVKVLEEVYSQMSRETKVQILEAIGHVGNLDSIPFLVDILNEPFQILRVVAASAMIQCLYH